MKHKPTADIPPNPRRLFDRRHSAYGQPRCNHVLERVRCVGGSLGGHFISIKTCEAEFDARDGGIYKRRYPGIEQLRATNPLWRLVDDVLDWHSNHV